MGVKDVVSTLREVPTLLALKKGMQPRPLDEVGSIAAEIEDNAARIGSNTALIFEDRSISWSAFNAMANRYAHQFRDMGVVKGDTVSLIMENRIEFLAVLIALNKLGAVVGLINTNLRERPLVHCVSTTESKVCVFGEELTEALAEVKDELDLEEGTGYAFVWDGGEQPAPNWALDLDAPIAIEADGPPVDPQGPPKQMPRAKWIQESSEFRKASFGFFQAPQPTAGRRSQAIDAAATRSRHCAPMHIDVTSASCPS